MKAIKQVLRQDRESYRVPRRVQDVIPIRRIWSDGIFLTLLKVILPIAVGSVAIRLVIWRFWVMEYLHIEFVK